MCSISIVLFFIDFINKEDFKNKIVLEVGSKDVNGSVQQLVKKYLNPKEYIGVDASPGKGVDKVIHAEKIIEHFGKNSFDVIISTEMLEHIKDWRLVIKNLKNVVKEGGHIFISTRSKGKPYHGFPFDFWRYEFEDIKKIFSDFEILQIKKDVLPSHGIIFYAKKPIQYKPNKLDDISLFSMLYNRRIKFIPKNNKQILSLRIKSIFIKIFNMIEYLVHRVRMQFE